MQSSMMSMPLTISSLIEHAARYHGETEVISVETDGTVATSNWSRIESDARKLSAVLSSLHVSSDACCATVAWNNKRHLQIYFGVAAGGRVCHTINPRLFPEQIEYIVNHAADEVVFFDKTFTPLVRALKDKLQTVKHYIFMGESDDEVKTAIPEVLFYDELLASASDDYIWPALDENTPSSLCYTSGTTGHPKGVLYTHRTTVLHSIGGNQPDGLAISAKDTVLPVVPMFHVNAWGVPYIAAAVGCRMVLPGPGLDGDSLVRLIDGYGVSLALGVPTIWIGLLAALEKTGSKVPSLKRTVVGGSALPTSMLQDFRDNYQVDSIHAWGMTETSPLGTINQPLFKHLELPEAEYEHVRLGQGRPLYGIELRLVDDDGVQVAEDGESHGRLQTRGLWVVSQYYKASESALSEDGWFDTGDVATIDNDGYLIIRDRSKDMIKSGGEWISSVELENIAMSHPSIAQAAAIAAAHKQWDERPVMIVVRHENAELREDELLQFFDNKIASWQKPDAVIFVDALPLGGTGKVLKTRLREQYGRHLL